MADLVDGFGRSANGVSPAERGLGNAAAPPRLARDRGAGPPGPMSDTFDQSDEEFARTLVMVLVHERQLWARERALDTPPIRGAVPRRAGRDTQEELNRQLPRGGFDLLRNEFRRELRDWENFAESVVLQNFHDLRQAALHTLLDFIDRTLATLPGPGAGTMDVVSIINGAVGFALGEVLNRFGTVGNAVSSGITTVSDIIANHVAEGMARGDLAGRRAHITRALTNDPSLLGEWSRGIYRINLIDDYYGFWLHEVPNEELLGFRIPSAPDSHPPARFESLLRRGLSLAIQRTPAAPRLNELALLAWLEDHGLAVNDHRMLRELLLGRPVRTTVLRPHRFPGGALRPPREVSTLHTIIVQLFPPGVDVFRHQPLGMLAIHEPTAAAFLHRFSDGLYVNPENPSEARTIP